PRAFHLHRHDRPRALHSFPTRRSSDLKRKRDHAHAPLPVVSPQKLWHSTVVMPQEGHMAESKLDLLQGTLDLMVLRTLAALGSLDRKSTRLNSSHVEISYAVFCLKKQN